METIPNSWSHCVKSAVYGVILVRIIPHSSWIRTRITPITETFHAVNVFNSLLYPLKTSVSHRVSNVLEGSRSSRIHLSFWQNSETIPNNRGLDYKAESWLRIKQAQARNISSNILNVFRWFQKGIFIEKECFAITGNVQWSF